MNKEQHTGTAIAVVKKKKVMLGIVAVLGICACGISGYAIYNDDRPVEPTNLPAGITEFVTQFFPGRQITAAEIDFMDYEIWLDDNTHVEFEWNRKWEQIESYESIIHPGLIPPAITVYVEQNHQGAIITKIAKESSGYEVEISGNSSEYKFTKAGRYRYMEWDD